MSAIVRMLFVPRFSVAFVLTLMGVIALEPHIGWWAYPMAAVAGFLVGWLEDDLGVRK